MTKRMSLREVQNELRGSSYPLATLSEIRGKINPSDFSDVVAWLPRLRHKGRGIFHGQYPARIGDLRKDRVPECVLPEREVAWARHMLAAHAPRINVFLQFTRDFERNLVSGTYQKCVDILKEIDLQCGFSLWTIENRIALLQFTEGLEKQKAYVAEIRNSAIQPIIAFMAFYLSQRNEDTATPEHFVSRFAARLESWDVAPDLKSYLRFRITNHFPADEIALADILRLESASTIVDYYDTFIRVGQEIIINESNPLRGRFLSELRKLAPLIHDSRATKLLFAGTTAVELTTECSIVDLAAANAHADGRYEESCSLAARARENGTENLNNLVIEAEARIEGKLSISNPDPSLASRIVSMLSTVLAKKDEGDNAVLGLSRIALNFRLMRFSTGIDSFLEEEQSSDPNLRSSVALKAFLDSHYIDPAFLCSFSSMETREAYAHCLIATYGTGKPIVIPIIEYGMGNLVGTEELLASAKESNLDAALVGQMRARLAVENAEDALTIARQLSHSCRQRTQHIAKRFEGHCLIKLGRLEDAIQFTVCQYLSEPGMIHMLPLKACVTSLDDTGRERLAPRLSTPIILDLYSRYVTDNLNHIRAYSYEDFLLSHGLKQPSQLSGIESQFDRKELIYYLQFICIPSIMNVSIAFGSTRELEEERLGVALLLSKLDPANSGSYEEEVREITRNLMIQQCVRQVEQSKIFVDAVALRRWADKNLKESFTRYQALRKAGIGVSDIDFLGVIQDLHAGRPIPKEFLELPKNEAADLLRQIVRELLGECAGNPEYGLDCYLSIRIRHGTLSGQLRYPLEMEKLITQRISDMPKYQPNEHWISRLTTLGPSSAHAIDERLSTFSHDYDAFIERFTKEHIQIHGEEKKNGLFVVAMDVVQIRYLATQIKDDTTFSQFMDTFFELFWEGIRRCLKNICNVIDKSLKPEVSQLFTKLEEDISAFPDITGIADLKRAIRSSRTSGLYALDKVKGWFTLSQPLEVHELTFDYLVDIGLQSVKNIHGDFVPLLTKNFPDLPPIKGGLNLFSDIFFIVFDNIRRHSGIKTGCPNVEVAVEHLGNRLRVIVRNEVGNEANIPEIKIKVDRIRQAITDGAYQDIVRSEGGTGFSKLWKLINTELNPNKNLDFGFGEDGRFFVQFEVPAILQLDTSVHEAEVPA